MQLENFQSYSKQFQNWNWFTKANVFVVCTNWHGIIIRLIKIIENLKLRIIEITHGFRNILWAKKQNNRENFSISKFEVPKNIFDLEPLNKVLFAYRYTWQNIRLRHLSIVNRLYEVIHKTQKSKTKVLPYVMVL